MARRPDELSHLCQRGMLPERTAAPARQSPKIAEPVNPALCLQVARGAAGPAAAQAAGDPAVAAAAGSQAGGDAAGKGNAGGGGGGRLAPAPWRAAKPGGAAAEVRHSWHCAALRLSAVCVCALHHVYLNCPGNHSTVAASSTFHPRPAACNRRTAREQQRLAVLEWKRVRQEQEQAEQQRAEEEARAAQERERRARQARQQELLGVLTGYRQQKAERYQQRVAAAESAPPSRQPTPDPEAQQRVAARSQQMLSKRQELAQRRASQAQEREARLQQLQEQVGWRWF